MDRRAAPTLPLLLRRWLRACPAQGSGTQPFFHATEDGRARPASCQALALWGSVGAPMRLAGPRRTRGPGILTDQAPARFAARARQDLGARACATGLSCPGRRA